MDPDMAILHVSMLMTDGIYCFVMSVVIVATLIALFIGNRSVRAEHEGEGTSMFTEAIRCFDAFDFKAEACVMGLESEAGNIALALVMRLEAEHIFDSVKRAEAKKAMKAMRPHMAVAVRRLLAEAKYWGF
jgi:hypothetical protein